MRAIWFLDDDIDVPQLLAGRGSAPAEVVLGLAPARGARPGLDWAPLDDPHSEAARQKMMAVADLLVEQGGPRFLDVDLLETIRYELIFGVEEDLAHLRTLSRALSRGVSEFHLVGTPEKAAPLLPIFRARRVRADVSPVSMPSFRAVSAWRRLRGTGYEIAQGLPRRGTSRVRPEGNGVLFADYFPNSARLAADVMDELVKRAPTLPLGVLAGRQSVAKDTPYPRSVLGDESQWLRALALTAWPSFVRATNALVNGLGPRINQLLEVDPSLQQAVAARIRRAASRLIWRAAIFIADLHAATRDLKPRALVTTTYSSVFGRSLALVARKEGIKTAYLQHGILGDAPFFHRFENDLVMVWGKSNRRAIVSGGVPAERIRVVGASHLPFGPMVAPEMSTPRRVLYCASRAGGAVVGREAFVSILSALDGAVGAAGDARLTVKLHPSDHTGLAKKHFEHRPDVQVVQDGDSLALLGSCDVAIVVSSTTGLEACALGRRLLVYNPEGLGEFVDYGRFGAAVVARNPAELCLGLRQLLDEPEVARRIAEGQARLVDEMLRGPDDDAPSVAARVAASIETMV